MYEYNIPRRLKKQGILGTLQTPDLVGAGVLGLIGIGSAAMIGGFVGLAVLGICAFTAFVFFIMQNPFDENLRIMLKRARLFAKTQKLYYYRRANK